MNLRVSGFDWDEGNRAKCQKHGVSIMEIEQLFTNGPRVAPDPKHSTEEDRFDRGGKNKRGAGPYSWPSRYGRKTKSASFVR